MYKCRKMEELHMLIYWLSKEGRSSFKRKELKITMNRKKLISARSNQRLIIIIREDKIQKMKKLMRSIWRIKICLKELRGLLSCIRLQNHMDKEGINKLMRLNMRNNAINALLILIWQWQKAKNRIMPPEKSMRRILKKLLKD